MKKKMRNPLWKRLPRELVGDIGKYLVIFLFMTATIGFVSGFLVADESMLEAYDESFEKYRIENGNFTLDSQATEEKLEELEQEGVTIYENFYLDEPVDVDLDGTSDGTMRIFKNGRSEPGLPDEGHISGDGRRDRHRPNVCGQ